MRLGRSCAVYLRFIVCTEHSQESGFNHEDYGSRHVGLRTRGSMLGAQTAFEERESTNESFKNLYMLEVRCLWHTYLRLSAGGALPDHFVYNN